MKTLFVILFLLTLAASTYGQSQPLKTYIEAVGKTQWKIVNSDTAVYMIQKDPYRPRETRMVWVNKKTVSGYRIKLYTLTQMDSIRATQ